MDHKILILQLIRKCLPVEMVEHFINTLALNTLILQTAMKLAGYLTFVAYQCLCVM